MLTASNLYALARGVALRPGPHRCWYCGASCDDSHAAATWVKDNCTTRQYAAAPASAHVCAGCVCSLDESASVHVHGEPAPRAGQRTRLYSWVIDREQARAYTKAHLAALTAWCLSPPEPPWCIVLATSGQKQLIYRAPVNHGAGPPAALMLEDERVHYDTDALRDALDAASRVVACTGKPALAERPGFSIYRACADAYGTTEAAERWSSYFGGPLGRLAGFLAPAKEVCRVRYALDGAA